MSVLEGYQELVHADNIYHLNRFKCVPPTASYIAGFIDGDGCIFIRKIKDGFQSGIQISQSRTNVLQIFKNYFGGNISQNHVKKTKESNAMRNQYCLVIRSNQYKSIINYISNYVVIKTEQINSLKKMMMYVNKVNMNNEKTELYERCSNANKNKTFDEHHLSKINADYISGLFDAEGCLYINKNNTNKHYISITQTTYPAVLTKIQEYLGYGNIDYEEGKLKIYSKENSLKFIELVENNLIVKYNQTQYFKTYLLSDDSDVKYKMYEKCNYEKHVNEEYSNDMYNDIAFVDNYNNFGDIFKNKQNVLSSILTNDFENRLKPVKTITRNAKNQMSDDIIFKVRELMQCGKMNVEIEEELKLKRHVVSRIRNNVIVPKNETKRSVKSNKSKEQLRVEKRKINISTVLKIIDDLISGKKSIHIVNEIKLTDETCKVTPDIVKNIKAQIKNKIIPFYNFEVSNDVYEHYKNAIDESTIN